MLPHPQDGNQQRIRGHVTPNPDLADQLTNHSWSMTCLWLWLCWEKMKNEIIKEL